MKNFHEAKFKKLKLRNVDITDRDIWDFRRALRCCFVFLDSTWVVSELSSSFGDHFGQNWKLMVDFHEKNKCAVWMFLILEISRWEHLESSWLVLLHLRGELRQKCLFSTVSRKFGVFFPKEWRRFRLFSRKKQRIQVQKVENTWFLKTVSSNKVFLAVVSFLEGVPALF